MKKAANLILALIIILLLSLVVAVMTSYGSSDLPQPGSESLATELAAFDERNGTKSFVDYSIDPSTVKIKFDTLEEYEDFIRSIKIVVEESPASERSYASRSDILTGSDPVAASPADITTLQKSIYKDAKIYGSGIYLGKLRNKVVVKYYYNTTYGQNRFYSWVSQSSYPTGTVYFTWDQDYETHSIVDSQRTLLSTVNGHLTVGAIVGGIYIGTMEVENLVYSYGYTML